MRVTVIGVGGIGTHLADWVARYLAWQNAGHTLTLVDGDTFEDRNKERQAFDKPGMKAQVVADMLSARYPGLRIEAFAEFVSPDNSEFVLLENEIVLLCVDNHPTRKLVSLEAGKRKDICIISGGNALTDGNMFVYLRRDGKDLTPPFTYDHPEIENPVGKAPYELSCEERAKAGEPQILCANLFAAVLMFCAFWRFTVEPLEKFVSDPVGEGEFAVDTAYTEAHFDIRALRAMSRRVVMR